MSEDFNEEDIENTEDTEQPQHDDFETLKEYGGTWDHKKKANKAETQRRITNVIQWITEGASRKTILHNITEKWGVKHRQAQLYLEDAYEYFKEQAKFDREKEIGKAIDRLEMIFHRALQKDDLSTCRLAESDKAKLLGLTNVNVYLPQLQGFFEAIGEVEEKNDDETD